MPSPPSTRVNLNSSTPIRLVVEMLTQVDESLAMTHWQGIIAMASTRYSTSSGCQTAAEDVHALFDAYGLNPTYEDHTSGHAPSVIGTIEGQINPEQIVIVIGHLDDMPSSGPAPGADDNASGSAMVTALAEVMSEYGYAKTLRFIAVTGEEFGLYGAYHHAAQAAAAGEDIQAVLNGDMIGWEGDGIPATEDMDINYNTGSAWLGALMTQVAADYPTGAVVNAFECNSMAYSDHWPFWQRGWSAVCGITDNQGFCGQDGDYPYYHTSNDTIANCGSGAPAFMASGLRLYLATAGHLADPLCLLTEAPTGVSAVPNGDNRVDLGWSSAGSGLSYEIRRAPGGCAAPDPATVVGETQSLSFNDTTASGGLLYAYTIHTKDPSGYCPSEPSTCVEVSTTGPCIEPPNFSGVATVTDSGNATCQLTVGWSDPATVYCGIDVAYNVYRSATPGFDPGPANRIATLVSGNSFDDYGVVHGEDYHYVVRAVDLSHGFEDDNEVEIQGTPTGPPAIGDWLDDAGDTGTAKLTPTSPWTVQAAGGNTGPMVYATGSYPDLICSGATTPPLQLGTNPQLSFWSRYDIEDNWDKGQVEVSTDGGSNWERVPVNYPDNANRASDACDWPTGDFFSGNNPSYAGYTASLDQWSNQDVLLRWAISSDTSVNGTGWWVDDISITNVSVPGACTSSQDPPPGAFGKASPTDGAIDQPLSLTLSWGPSTDATSYEFCVDTSNNASCDGAWVDAGGATSTGIGPLQAGWTYYWQVRAVNANGTTGANSGTWWQFSTEIPLPVPFGKLDPADGAVDQPLTVDFFWEESAGSTSYRFCIDTTDDGSCAPWTDVGSFLMVQVPGLDTDTTYYWQVEAVNGWGTTLADGGAWWSLATQPQLFADGFESGDTSAWTAAVP